jgi:hypothetical protein
LACGYIGLSIDEFYKLTPRQFYNIQKGFERKKEDEFKLLLILNRSLKFAVIFPHLKNQNTTEEKVFPLYFEKTTSSKIDLLKEIEEVEKQKIEFWSKIDALKGMA